MATDITQMHAGPEALHGHGEPSQAYVRACLAEALADLPSGRRLVEAHLSLVQGELLLASVYGWFTEGFDTANLQEANALLETLRA